MTHLATRQRKIESRGPRGLFLGALLMLALWPADGLSAAPADDLRRALQRIDRQLCSKFNKPRCHRSAAKQKNQRGTKTESAPRTAAAAIPEKHPVPVLKPANLKARKIPALDTQQTASAEAAPGKMDLPETPKQPPIKTAMAPKPALKPQMPPPVVNVMPDDALSGEPCIAALRTMNVDFYLPAAPAVAGSCSVAEPVKVSVMGAGKGRVKFPDQPLLTCGFAARLASWLNEKGEPAVRGATGSPLQAMGTGPGYQCRGRNGDSSAKLSEHAFGNAVDIGYFKLADGQVINVADAGNAGSKNRAVLAALREAGCQYFTTVLGPGADAAHASHFHFDLERRGKKGNNKLCQ